MMYIPPPIPAPDIPLRVERELQEAANEIASIAVPLVRDIVEREPDTGYRDLHERLENWLYEEGGVGYIAAEVGWPFLGSGADRLVFDLGAFVAKFEFVRSEANAAEWDSWHKYLSTEHRLWFARPYALSEDGTVVVMEKLILPGDTQSEVKLVKVLVSEILKQEPWMIEVVDDPAWYNWGYRIGSETPVVLDYGP
jgi:hypothetical protein